MFRANDDYGDFEAASAGNPHLKQMLASLVHFQRTQQQQSGPTSSSTPPNANFTVEPLDGTFIVEITLPQNIIPAGAAVKNIGKNKNANYFGVQVFHELQSSTNETFDANGSVHIYGPSTKTRWDITDTPNSTRFWRLRSSYDQTTWNAWTYLLDATICGVVPVWSGLVRSSRSSIVDSATTPQGGNPLTQHGVTTRIDVASSVWNAGDQSSGSAIHYNSGFVDPGSFGTYGVYANDPKRAGGTVTFIATLASADVTSDNGNIFFGVITTSGGGGGTGSGGGGGTCCRGSVPVRMFDGSVKLYSELRKGDCLLGINQERETIQRITLHAKRPCFHLEFDESGKLRKKEYIGDFTVYQIELDHSHTFIAGADGIIDGAAGNHPIQRKGGGFIDVFRALVGEEFNLIKGGLGSHNTQKPNLT